MMVAFLAARVRAGKLALEAVPLRWREAVAQALQQDDGGNSAE